MLTGGSELFREDADFLQLLESGAAGGEVGRAHWN